MGSTGFSSSAETGSAGFDDATSVGAVSRACSSPAGRTDSLVDLVLTGLPVWGALSAGFLGALASLGGLVMSSFSCLLFAELAVGRISLASEESSTGRELRMLAREVGRSWEEVCCGAREAREPCLRTVVVVADGTEGLDVPVVRGAEGLKVDGLRLRAWAFAVLAEVLFRLEGREGDALGFAVDDAAGASMDP